MVVDSVPQATPADAVDLAAHPPAPLPVTPLSPTSQRRYVPKPPEDGGEQDEWLLSYADMVSLLLIMFISLLLNANYEKAGEGPGTGDGEGGGASRFLQELFQIQVISPYEGGETYTITGANDSPSAVTPESGAALAVVKETDLDRIRQREQALTEIKARIKNAQLDPFINAFVEGDGIRLNIPNSILFATGESELLGRGPAVIRALGPILAAGGFTVSVEGHTDNVPINTDRFPSNWELSAQRAATVVRVLAEAGINLTRLEAVGYGESRPLVTNETEDGRRENRRVTLLLRL